MPPSLTDIVGSILKSCGISYLVNASPLHSIKRKSQINDAITEADAEFAKKTRTSQLEEAYNIGKPLPGDLAQIAEEQTTQRIEGIAEIQNALLAAKSEARLETTANLTRQLLDELVIVWHTKNYEAVLSLLKLLAPYLEVSGLSKKEVLNIEGIYIESMCRMIDQESAQSKKQEYYDVISVHIAQYRDRYDFPMLFEYSYASLMMFFASSDKQNSITYLDNAENALADALIMDPNSDISLTNFALSLRTRELYTEIAKDERVICLKKALEYLGQAQSVAPDNYKTYINIGYIYSRLAELSINDQSQQADYLECASHAFTDSLSGAMTYSATLQNADTLFALAKVIAVGERKENLLKKSLKSYADAKNIAENRKDAAIACIKAAYVYEYIITLSSVPENERDSMPSRVLSQYIVGLEIYPFFSYIQYKTGVLILEMAKHGSQYAALAKMLPNLSGKTKKTSKQLEWKMKLEILNGCYRYFNDASMLEPDNPEILVTWVEVSAYWVWLQKKIGDEQAVLKELGFLASNLEKADSLDPKAAAYVRACLHAVKNEESSSEHWLQEALQHGLCPPANKLKEEPYFSSYANKSWFKKILEACSSPSEGTRKQRDSGVTA